MGWFIGGVILTVLVISVGAWIFGPTVRTFFGPDFEPAPKDDASVENAIQTRMVDGGSGGM
jgi:hypothetical protein